MKSNYSTNFFKAYSLWKNTLENDDKYKGYLKSLQTESSGVTALSGTVGNKILDLEWLEKIEEALPFMDEAIRESRSFIEQRDEIVSIEKVKRVNTQSIRHLAQHTNMIAKVEANGDVKPDRILNIYYESSYAIYENRFLYTLLGKLTDFVNKRYNDLRSKDEKISVKYDINKAVRRKNKTSKMTLEFEYESQADTRKVDLKEDVSHLSGYSRVVRIRRILSDFYSLTLIKNLHGSEPVRPPIIQTNLLTKNVNFRTCVELWDFVSAYRKNGYIYEDKEYSGKMPKRTENELSDVFVFANFLTEMTFNADLKKRLEREYKQQLKQEKAEEKERLQLELTKRKEETAETVRKALERKTSPLYKKIESLEDRYKRLQFKHDALQYKHKIMIDMANDVMEQHKHIEEEQQNIRSLKDQIKQIEMTIRNKNRSIVEARYNLNKANQPITEDLARQKVKEQREAELKEKVLKYQAKKQEELREHIRKYQLEKMAEFKQEILDYQDQKQQEFKALPVNVHGLKEDELDIDPVEIIGEEEILKPVIKDQDIQTTVESDNIVQFELPTEKNKEEQELEELLKRLEQEEYENEGYMDFGEEPEENVSEIQQLKDLIQKLENEEQQDAEVIEFEKLENQKSEEQKLDELIKRLKELK